MNDAVLTYSLNDTFYTILLNNKKMDLLAVKNNNIKKDISRNEIELAKIILKKTNAIQYRYLGKKIYKNELLHKYVNIFDEKLYFSKLINGQEIICNKKDYRDLYLKSNELFAYGSGYGNGSNNFFGNSSNNNGFGSNTTNSSYGSNGNFNEEDPFEKRRREKERKRKKRKQVLISIGASLLILVSVITIGLKEDIIDINIFDKDNDTSSAVTEVVDYKRDVEEIKSHLKNNGYSDFVIEQVIDSYNKSKNPDQVIEEELVTYSNKDVLECIESLNNNSNIKPEHKIIFNNYVAKFILENKDTLDIERIKETLSTIKINEDYKEEGYILDGETRVGGYYDMGTNEITLFNNEKSTLTHEFLHSVIRLEPMFIQLYEGYTEFNNPAYVENITEHAYTYQPNQIAITLIYELHGIDYTKELMNDTNILYTYSTKENGYDANSDENYMFYVRVEEILEKQISNEEKIRDLLVEFRYRYEKLNPGKKADDNQVYKVISDMINKTNTSGLELKEDETIIGFIEKDGKLEVITSLSVKYNYIEETDGNLSYNTTITHANDIKRMK